MYAPENADVSAHAGTTDVPSNPRLLIQEVQFRGAFEGAGEGADT